MRRKALLRIGGAALLAAAALLAPAASASARTLDVYTHQPTLIDGFESTAGTLCGVTAVSVRQVDGRVFVMDPCRYEDAISQFAPDGTPQPFSALLEEETSISMKTEGGYDLQVDNSEASSSGTIYGLNSRSNIKAFRPDGTELGGNFPLGGFVEACGVAVDPDGNIWVSNYFTSSVVELTSLGVPTGKKFETPFPCRLAIDADGNFYVQERYANVRKYDSEGNLLFYVNSSNSGSLTVDRSTGNLYVVEIPGSTGSYVQEYAPDGTPLSAFGFPEGGFTGLEGYEAGIAIRESTKEVYVGNGHDYGGRQHVEVFKPGGTATVPTVSTDPPTIGTTEATLRGTIDLDGAGDATECQFEWGKLVVGHPFLGTVDHAGPYEASLPCDQALPITGAGPHQVTATLPGLKFGSFYHYRLVSRNGNGLLATGVDRAFRPQGPATVSGVRATEVNTDGARVEADIEPNGGNTTYRVEYGPEDCSVASCQSTPVKQLPNALGDQTVAIVLGGLEPDTAYHFRVVATNELGSAEGDDEMLRTFAIDSGVDDCQNAFVRKQTTSAELPDCRAYELVSAADAGGYDVRSDIVEGQQPFVARPRAVDKLLYTLNFGKVPGVDGEPPSLGYDPYVAHRTATGWQTDYAGIDVGFPPEQGPFSSQPTEESADLSAFAFGGPDGCSPCFADGKTGIPIRRAQGSVVQGMAGSLDPGSGAEPDGYVGRQLSGDGSHLVFGSTSKFEPDGNSNGDISIYDRNLNTGQTDVVSKAPTGETMTGPGIASLDQSADGSRIVVAQRVSTDSAGNEYWHPYMDVGDAGQSIDLAPGSTSGVIWDGMTATGSAALYTSDDRLTSDDHDNSADVFRATIGGAGSVTVTRVSTGAGGSGDTDACDPVAAGGRNNWNAFGSASANDCGAVAFAGGAGVAEGSGTVYFLSPEQLDGAEGTEDEPNLYAAAPGASPRFVATLEPDSASVQHAVTESAAHSYGDIQVTPSGEFAVFPSRQSLTGYPTFGHVAIYRYAAGSGQLECASCGITGAYMRTDTPLARYGSNISDDGRVFFTSREPLALRDSGSTADVYEWDGGQPQLISTGRSAADSGLASVSANGVDAFFFTRDVIVPEDHNGNTVKIYDAREGGGFEQHATPGACQASDECHGPGTVAQSGSSINTFQGTGGNFKPHKQKAKKKKRHHKRHRAGHRKRHAKSHHGGGR